MRATKLVMATVGETFDHARWKNTDGSPMRHRITRIAGGWIYYRPVSGGHAEKTTEEGFERIVSKNSEAHE